MTSPACERRGGEEPFLFWVLRRRAGQTLYPLLQGRLQVELFPPVVLDGLGWWGQGEKWFDGKSDKPWLPVLFNAALISANLSMVRCSNM